MSAATVAQRMLGGRPVLLLMRADSSSTARRFAASLHGELVDACQRSCWLHAEDDLAPAFRLATELPDHPLVVTTSTSEWSAFEDDRIWSERQASLVFVLAEGVVPRVPPQVACLLSMCRVSRRLRGPSIDPLPRPLLTECSRMLSNLLDDTRVLEMFAFAVGVEWSRINSGGAAEVVAFDIVQEAVRCDLLDRVVEELHRRYPRADTDDLRRRVFALCYGADG